MVGKHGLGNRNTRGEIFLQWCEANNQVIANTIFENHPRRKWTWRSPDNQVKNQIDYITICERFRNSIIQCKTYPGADCNSDHVPVVATMKIKLKKH